MVALSTIQSSNASALKTLFPYGPVGVFVGATNGIGRAALLALAKYATRPRLYFIGRSQSAADEVLRQLKEINPDGQYEFVKADASLLSNVDRICLSIQAKETKIDISDHGPWLLLQNALHRQSSSLASTLVQPARRRCLGWHQRRSREPQGHPLERFAQSAPDVSFVHSYPGFVRTSLDQSIRGVTGVIVRSITTITNMFVSRHWIPLEETGERHVFLATAPRFPSKERHTAMSGKEGGQERTEVAVASDGQVGAGVYTVDETCESGNASVQEVLCHLRENQTDRKIWEHLDGVFQRVTGHSSIR